MSEYYREACRECGCMITVESGCDNICDGCSRDKKERDREIAEHNDNVPPGEEIKQ